MYDPDNDVTLACACGHPIEDDYPEGWDDFFKHELVPQQKMVMAAEIAEGFCPRSMIRHALARAATQIAIIAHGSPEAEAVQSVESILAEAPEMLKQMTVDAVVEIAEKAERTERGAAAGWKKVTVPKRLN